MINTEWNINYNINHFIILKIFNNVLEVMYYPKKTVTNWITINNVQIIVQ